jgi:hypothetical protein
MTNDPRPVLLALHLMPSELEEILIAMDDCEVRFTGMTLLELLTMASPRNVGEVAPGTLLIAQGDFVVEAGFPLPKLSTGPRN